MFLQTSDKTNVMLCFQIFLSLWMERCYTSKDQSPENGLSCIFQAEGSILLSLRNPWCRVSMTKHRQQTTHVRAKGMDSVWSQVCSSLLQSLWLKWTLIVSPMRVVISVSTCTSFIQLSSEAIGGAMWERSKIKGVRIGKEEIKPMYSQMAWLFTEIFKNSTEQ